MNNIRLDLVDELGGNLVSAEEHKSLGHKGYLQYLIFCGGYFIMLSLMLLVLLFTLARLFSGIWLQRWLDEGDGYEVNNINVSLINFVNYVRCDTLCDLLICIFFYIISRLKGGKM